MKIAVLNECFLSDNHITYLKSIGDVEIFNDTTDETTAITRMAGKDIVLGDMFECPLNEKVLSNCPSVKLLCINSTGYDLVHLPTAIQNKTQVTNVPGFSTEAVAEHSFGLLLAVNRHIVSSNLGSDQIRSDQISSAQAVPNQSSR